MYKKFQAIISSKFLLLIIIFFTPAFCYISFHINSYIIPIFCAIPAYISLLVLIKRREKKAAVCFMLIWAFLLAVSMTYLIYMNPSIAKNKILYGEQYAKEMINWAKTGIGKESSPQSFIPFHFLELVIFTALSLFSGSLLSIIMGNFLMNYMSYYVAFLAKEGKTPLLLILGWHPWAIVRIIAFVIFGVIFSEFLLSKIFHFNFSLRESSAYIKIAISLWIIHLVMKITLASHWQMIIYNYLK